MSKSPKYRMVPPMRTGEPPLIGRAKVDVSIRLSDKDVLIAELLEALKQATDELDGYIIDQEAQLEGHPEYKRRHLYETQRVRDNLCAAIEKGCCPECGTPWVREMEVHDPDGRLGRSWHDDDPKERLAIGQRGTPRGEGRPIHRTSGWQPLCDCGAGDPAPCTVLDPFGGSGTVGLVASRLGRDAILIELNPEYAEMAERRIHGDAPLPADVGVSA